MHALLVDDERLARRKLRGMLEAEGTVTTFAEADSVGTAMACIAAQTPDVVFLDIQMPGESGFDLLRQQQPSFRVIFVTAFDEHALRAFEVNALDYLLKPVHPERLAEALARLRAGQVPPPPAPLGPERLTEDAHLFLTDQEPPQFVQVRRIVCITAEGAYSRLHLSNSASLLTQRTMRAWVATLPEATFVRIHRSAIINVAQVQRIDKWFNYSYRVHLHHYSEPLTMSRRYAAQLKTRFR